MLVTALALLGQRPLHHFGPASRRPRASPRTPLAVPRVPWNTPSTGQTQPLATLTSSPCLSRAIHSGTSGARHATHAGRWGARSWMQPVPRFDSLILRLASVPSLRSVSSSTLGTASSHGPALLCPGTATGSRWKRQAAQPNREGEDRWNRRERPAFQQPLGPEVRSAQWKHKGQSGARGQG